MAMQVQPLIVGVGVSKAELVVSIDGAPAETIANERRAIRHWLDSFHQPMRLALEATGVYHVLFAEEAHRRGHGVYVVNGYRLHRYRESVGGRAKTDASDARLLARYLRNEGAQLRPWTPPPQAYRRLQTLLHRRATLVRARVAIQQSLQDVPVLRKSLQEILRQLKRTDAAITRQIQAALSASEWQSQARRCQQIEGVGPVTAAALTMAFHRGAFASSDAFIAFLGLDVRVRDSGKQRGRRKLTKAGDPELRRLLYLAAMYAKRQPTWAACYERHLARGLKPVQALNVLARKLARVAFTLMKNEIDYVPQNP